MKLFSFLMATLCIAAATAGDAAKCKTGMETTVEAACVTEAAQTGTVKTCGATCQTAIDTLYNDCEDQTVDEDKWDPTIKAEIKPFIVGWGCSSASAMAPAMLATTVAALFAAFQ